MGGGSLEQQASPHLVSSSQNRTAPYGTLVSVFPLLKVLVADTTFLRASDGRVFEWSYASTKDANGKRVNIIALREKDSRGVLAQLIRGEGEFSLQSYRVE